MVDPPRNPTTPRDSYTRRGSGSITADPTGAWTTQAAPATSSCATTTGSQDRERWCETGAARFIDTFDEIFRTEVLKILKTPVRTPVADTTAGTLDPNPAP